MMAYKGSQLGSINLGGHIRHLMDLFRNLFSAANKMCCTPLVLSGQNISKESLFVLEMQYKSTICRDHKFRVRIRNQLDSANILNISGPSPAGFESDFKSMCLRFESEFLSSRSGMRKYHTPCHIT